MTTATLPSLAIRLERDCEQGSDRGGSPCAELAAKTHAQLSAGGYESPCSLLRLPATISTWAAEHRTARKRAAACERRGYSFLELERADWEDDIFAINTSLPERQGRPMSDGYRERQRFSPLPVQPCDRHRISAYGVLSPERQLVAYLVAHRVGELVLVSQILGHAGHLDAGVMYLLFRESLLAQIAAGKGTAFYNRDDSGTEGLVWFKRRLGFEPGSVEWLLA